ncbi:hypothetical protein Scep_030079 [Stephania cephalantha]|uniref:Uncharacterized protein n=1 Tax=Stephania cephalantha TaxID=152367 RepID=A0AAP0HCV4_9MAGN
MHAEKRGTGCRILLRVTAKGDLRQLSLSIDGLGHTRNDDSPSITRDPILPKPLDPLKSLVGNDTYWRDLLVENGAKKIREGMDLEFFPNVSTMDENNHVLVVCPKTVTIEGSEGFYASVCVESWLFVFKFPLEEDRQVVLEGGHEGLIRIGNAFDRLLYTDKQASMVSRLAYARIFVEVEASYAFSDSISIVEEENGFKFNQRVEYDWQPSRCSFRNVFSILVAKKDYPEA